MPVKIFENIENHLLYTGLLFQKFLHGAHGNFRRQVVGEVEFPGGDAAESSTDNSASTDSAETKAEAESKVNKKNHYFQIIEILNDFDKPMTAKEIAIEMKNRGYSKTDEKI